MVSLHVDLQLKPGAGPELEKTFAEIFRSAVSAQPGFSRVTLLKSSSEADRYRLVIDFRSEKLRLDWVATPLHQQVWPRMEAHCASYEVMNFNVV